MVSAFKSNDICFKIDAYTWGKKAEEIDVIGRLKPRKEFVAYDVILERTLAANVIIDIVDNNAPITLRAYEAVVYNKKLLTNNKKILEFKYYDRRYIQYFEKVEDINWDWVKESVNVNYSYTGDFSPAGVIPPTFQVVNLPLHTPRKKKKEHKK